jgi:hypothetical protein
MTRLSGYKRWIAIGIALLLIGVLLVLTFGCGSESGTTGTGTYPG